MNRFFGQDTWFSRFMNKVGNLIGVTLLWLAACLPVLTIGASSIALYKTTVKYVRRGEGTLVKGFFSAFMDSLKNGVIMTALLLVLGTILAIDRMYIDQFGTQGAAVMSLLYTLLIVSAISVVIYLWPVMSRFEMGRWKCFRLALLMVFRHLPFTAVFWAIWLAGIFLVALIPVPLVFIVPGLCTYLESFFMEKLLRKYMAKPQTEEEQNKWYYQ